MSTTKNDVLDEIIGELNLAPEAGIQLADPSLVSFYKDYKERVLWIDKSIDERLFAEIRTIIQWNRDDEKDKIPVSKRKPIWLIIHSYGGDLEQSLMFCDLLISSRIPIITVAMGVAMSCGFLIFLAGSKKYAFKHSSLLAHSGSAGFHGTAEQIEEAQKNYKKQLSQMKEYILSRTEIPEKVFNKNKSKDWYLTAEELTEFKVVDKLIEDFGDIFN